MRALGVSLVRFVPIGFASIVSALGCHRAPPAESPSEAAPPAYAAEGAPSETPPDVPPPGSGGSGTPCEPGKLASDGTCECPPEFRSLGGVGGENWRCVPVAAGDSWHHAGYPELTITELEVGTGSLVKPGDTIEVTYVGTLEDGTVFDEATSPTKLTVGKGVLIKGWDYGVPGMRVGGRRRLFVPASLGYGEKGAPPKIPPFSALIFTIEVVGVSP